MATAPEKLALPRERRFTVDEYYRMGEAGVFGADDRIELIAGRIYAMSPIGSEHASCVDRLTRLFVSRTTAETTVRVQNPIRLDQRSEPEPDLALVQSTEDDYKTRHPGPEDALLVIEVAETSFAFDRDIKRPVYAEAGIPEFWIIDLKRDQVHVYRDPETDRYREHSTHGPGDQLRVSTAPSLQSLPVDSLLNA